MNSNRFWKYSSQTAFGSSRRAVILKLRSADPKGSAGGSQVIRLCISVMAALKFTYFLIKGITFFLNNRGTSLTGDMFISYDR
jgi:hypothetical protein